MQTKKCNASIPGSFTPVNYWKQPKISAVREWIQYEYLDDRIFMQHHIASA